MSPSSPGSAISLSFATPGWYSSRWPTISVRPVSRAAVDGPLGVRDGLASGFSTKQCLPASQHLLGERRVGRDRRGEDDGVERRRRRAARRGRRSGGRPGSPRRPARARRRRRRTARRARSRGAPRSCGRGSGPSSRARPRRPRSSLTAAILRASAATTRSRPARRRRAAAARPAACAPARRAAAAASRSTSVFQPASTVSVHSVVSRSVTHGMPREVRLLLHPAASRSARRGRCGAAR